MVSGIAKRVLSASSWRRLFCSAKAAAGPVSRVMNVVTFFPEIISLALSRSYSVPRSISGEPLAAPTRAS